MLESANKTGGASGARGVAEGCGPPGNERGLGMTTAGEDAIFDPDSGELQTGIADLVASNPSVTVGDLLPQLRALGDTPVPAGKLPTRIRNRIPSRFPSALAELRLGALVNMKNVGVGSIAELVENLYRYVAFRSATASEVPDESALSSSIHEEAPVNHPGATVVSDAWVHGLESISAIAATDFNAATLGDLLQVNPDLGDLPPTVTTGLAQILAVDIGNLHQPTIAQVFGNFIGQLDTRELTIAKHRIWGNDQLTLEETGERLGLTRERVRQLQRQIEGKLRGLLRDVDAAPLRARAESLRLRLGTAVPATSGLFVTAIEWALRDFDDDQKAKADDVLLWAAGPYESIGDWVTVDRAVLPDSAKARSDLLLDEGFAFLNEAYSYLDTLGINESVHETWLRDCKTLLVLETAVLDTSGNIVDLACRYLAIIAEPRTTDQILEALGRNMNPRGVKQRLMEDSRLIRITKDEFALEEWDFPAYTSVKDLMADAITKAGGHIDMTALIEQLHTQYDVSPGSIKMIAEQPMFRRDGHVLYLRTNDHPYTVRTDIESAIGAYELDKDLLSIRFLVDREILRGSGTSLHEAIAGWLGLRPGETLTLRSDDRSLEVKWRPWSAPGISSVRPIALALGAKEGDGLILLVSDEGEFAPQLVPASALDNPDWRIVARFLGLTASSDKDAERQVAEVLKVDAHDDGSRHFRILHMLRNSRDQRLYELVKVVMYS